mmetsp:Transcript_12968/g.25860  ORF Transcript_12968/g.25860 Transcript_12968/m.25860 type:complete len:209 (-) Transcript_12968:220-846(-)
MSMAGSEASTIMRAYALVRKACLVCGGKSVGNHDIPRKGFVTRLERRSAKTSPTPSSWKWYTAIRSHPKMPNASHVSCWHSSWTLPQVSSIPTAARAASLIARKSSHGSSSSTSAVIPLGLRWRMTLTVAEESPTGVTVMGFAASKFVSLSAESMRWLSTKSSESFLPNTSSALPPKKSEVLELLATIFWLFTSCMRKKTPCAAVCAG